GLLQLRSPVGTFGAVVVGIPGDRTSIAGIGELWLATNHFCIGVLGTQTAAGSSWAVAVPAAAAFDGAQFRWQALVCDGAAVALSPPGGAVLRGRRRARRHSDRRQQPT